MKNYLFGLLLSIALLTFSQSPHNNFDFLIGKWQGVERVVAGDRIGCRTYDNELADNYIFQKNQSAFPRTMKKPKGITPEIENNPGNWKTRLILNKISNSEFTENFDIASDGENFSSFLKNHWYIVN